MPHIFRLCVCNYLISSILYKVEKENDYFKKMKKISTFVAVVVGEQL